MTKKHNNSAMSGKTGGRPDEKIHVIMPKAINENLNKAWSADTAAPIVYEVEKEAEETLMSWFLLNDLSNTVAEMIATDAQAIHESVELVKLAGTITDVDRFNTQVRTVEQDINQFVTELEIIKDVHKDLHGFIQTSEDRNKYLTIFEKYQAFIAYFDGVMQHKRTEFTEYTLDALDILRQRESEEEAEAAAAQENTAVTTDPTEDPSTN